MQGFGTKDPYFLLVADADGCIVQLGIETHSKSPCLKLLHATHASQYIASKVPHLWSADQVLQACFKALMALLHTRHGSVREVSAVVLRQMTTNILGLAESTGAAATKAVPTSANPKHIIAVRSQALKFVQDVARCSASSLIAACVLG